MNIFQKLNKKSRQVGETGSQRCVAFLLLLTFFAQTAFAVPVIQGNTDVSQALIKVNVPSFLNELQIPAEMGHIENFAAPRNLNKNSHPILFIQDAHANPEAQKNIAAILNALAKNNQLAGVAVEGAFGPVDVRLLDVFDDEQTNREFSDQLVSQGQLTGAEIFSRDAEDFKVAVRGADDRELYLQSFKTYQQVMQDKVSHDVLEKYRKAAMRMEMTLLNPDLSKFLRERRNWLQKGSEAVDYVRLVASLAKTALGIELADPINQFEWPALMRLVRSLELEDQLNSERVQADIARLKKDWSGKAYASLFESSAEAFTAAIHDRGFSAWLEQQDNISTKTTRRFFEELSSASTKDGISLLNYPDLLSFAAILILHEEIVTKTLMDELTPLEEKIEAELIRSLKEREVVNFSKDLDLAEKLIHLKLTREDYHVLMQREADFSAAAMHTQLSAILSAHGLPSATDDLFVQATLDSALDFYRLSTVRDEVLVKKTVAITADNRKSSDALKVTVLIAGGFHQEGILRELNERGIEHAVITPKIKNMPAEPLYEKVMSGEGSALVKAISASASTLMAEILGESNYFTEGAAPWRREGVMLDGLFGWSVKQMVSKGQSPEYIYKALSRGLRRASAQGLIGRATLILKDAVTPGSSPELLLALADHGLVLHYEITPEGARQTHVERLPAIEAAMAEIVVPSGHTSQGVTDFSRSEVRVVSSSADLQLDPDAFKWFNELPRNAYHSRTLAMMELIERKKRAQTKPLTAFYAESLPAMGPPRSVAIIEALMDDVAKSGRLSDLPIAYRAAVVLQAFDKTHFKEIHEHLLGMFEGISLMDEATSDRLSAAGYRRLMSLSEREHLTAIDQYVLFQTAVNRYVIDLSPQESRALEKEAQVEEFIKELDQPGSGNIRQIVFLTDIHGGKKVGDLIGFALGLKNYRNIRSVSALQVRLAEEGIDINKKNILFVGGSDYVDRGPNPYRAFQFVRWLRDKGKLKFINGNHDDWKDWNLVGTHLRVHDTLRRIAASGRLDESHVGEYVKAITPFISTTKKSNAEIQKIESDKAVFIVRFLKAAREGAVDNALIDSFANEIIDSGANPNHSLEWWAREWYEHAGWADTFLDEMNEILINRVTEALNARIFHNPALIQQLLDLLSGEAVLQSFSAEERAAMISNLKKARLFDSIEAALFSEHADVKQAKMDIEELKKRNLEIRTNNEKLAAAGRHEEMVPQMRVPTTFPVTSRLAQEYLQRILDQATELKIALDNDELTPMQVELVTPKNYRANKIVSETALWDLQHTRLIYVDNLGNAYLHGIIPINEDATSLNVHYHGLDGVTAIERMQYDIRRFFEGYETIPDSPKFREAMEREVGDAFRILNDWYSDLTAYLKPPEVVKFMKAGGPAAFSYATASAFNPRTFDPSNGLIHVGHVDLAKMRESRLAYWINGLFGGMINGDHDLSEGYHGLGGVVIHFMRDSDGKLTGLRRFGYDETASSLAKEIKDKESAKKKKQRELDQLIPGDADVDSKRIELSQVLEALIRDIDVVKQRLAAKKTDVVSAGGETIKDITLHELPDVEQQNATPFLDGGDYVYYYAQRFLYELISDYKELEQEAKANGLVQRSMYYEQHYKLLRESLQFLHETHGAAHPLHPARAEVRSPKTLDELHGEISAVVARVNNTIDSWKADVIDSQTKLELMSKTQRISQILTDEEKEVLEAALIKLISDLRTLSTAPGETAADDVEQTLRPARQWESARSRRSEVRIAAALSFDQYLTSLGRNPEAVFFTAEIASRTTDLDLSKRYPSEIRAGLFGEFAGDKVETQSVVPKAEEQKKMDALVKSQQTVERPKTVVLVSVNGQVPQIDPSLMDLLPGSRVVILDRLGSEAVGRRQFSKLKLAPGLPSPEHVWFQGEYPTLDELNAVFEKPASARQAAKVEPGQLALPLLVLPYVEERFLNQYAALQSEDGIVVRTPQMRGERLRKSFSKFLGLRAVPSELRDLLPDEFKVQVREQGFSSAFIPLWAEGRFASLINAVLQTRTVESAA